MRECFTYKGGHGKKKYHRISIHQFAVVEYQDHNPYTVWVKNMHFHPIFFVCLWLWIFLLWYVSCVNQKAAHFSNLNDFMFKNMYFKIILTI
jgi:hypothetical protein